MHPLLPLLLPLISQTAQQPIPDATPTTWTFGGIITALAGVIAVLARAYVKARDDRDKVAKEIQDQILGLVTQSTTAHTLHTASNNAVAEALKALATRVEKVEEKIG